MQLDLTQLLLSFLVSHKCLLDISQITPFFMQDVYTGIRINLQNFLIAILLTDKLDLQNILLVESLQNAFKIVYFYYWYRLSKMC